MRNASRSPTGDDTVRKTKAHAVPLAALRITRASTMTDKNRCCWTHCQTTTGKSYPGRAIPSRSWSGGVRHPISVEARRHTLRELDDRLSLPLHIVGIEDVEGRGVRVGRVHQQHQPAVR